MGTYDGTYDDWFDDPIFDEAQENVGGNVFCGDDWRCLMRLGGKKRVKAVLRVAGTTYRADEVKALSSAKDRDVSLVPEPENRYDKLAVKVLVGGKHIWYVPQKLRVDKSARTVLFKAGSKPVPYVWLAVL